jgi:hypothetical protein
MFRNLWLCHNYALTAKKCDNNIYIVWLFCHLSTTSESCNKNISALLHSSHSTTHFSNPGTLNSSSLHNLHVENKSSPISVEIRVLLFLCSFYAWVSLHHGKLILEQRHMYWSFAPQVCSDFITFKAPFCCYGHTCSMILLPLKLHSTKHHACIVCSHHCPISNHAEPMAWTPSCL